MEVTNMGRNWFYYTSNMDVRSVFNARWLCRRKHEQLHKYVGDNISDCSNNPDNTGIFFKEKYINF